jgi:hypothetical protein
MASRSAASVITQSIVRLLHTNTDDIKLSATTRDAAFWISGDGPAATSTGPDAGRDGEHNAEHPAGRACVHGRCRESLQAEDTAGGTHGGGGGERGQHRAATADRIFTSTNPRVRAVAARSG